jgi:organic radical activating enzyme
MLISEVIVDSFQEYSGLQSTVFFSKGCNLNCPWCYNLETLKTKNVIGDYKVIFHRYINDMTQSVVFLGGEPTIHKDLKECISITKNKFPNLKIKLFTNGLNFEQIKNCYGLIDSISIDYKMNRYNSDVIGKDLSNYLIDINETITFCDKLVSTGNLDSVEIRTTKNSFVNHQDVKDIQKHLNIYKNVIFIEQNEFKFGH